MPGDRAILVVAGPPCSGKSTLARAISRKTGLVHLEMDEIRRRLLPDSDHGRRSRDIAYRAMHLMAENAVHWGASVLLDATYGPAQHRAQVEDVSRRTSANLYLVECRVSAELAVTRFRDRESSHPARDLNPSRVRELANAYPYLGTGLVLDTSEPGMEALECVLSLLQAGNAIDPSGQWSEIARGRW